MRAFGKLPASFIRTSIGTAAALTVSLALAACGKGGVIGSGTGTLPAPVVPSVTAETALPTANSGPAGIALGADGNLYIAESAANRIAKFSTSGAAATEVAVSPAGATPFDVLSLNANIWYTEPGANAIGEDIAGTPVAFTLPTANADPTYITLGNDGGIWFSETAANKIGRIDPSSHAVTEYALPTANAGAAGIASSGDYLYIVESNASQIARFNTTTLAFDPSAYPTLTANASPQQIVAYSDGSLYFTENAAVKLGHITPSGIVTEYPLGTAKSAENIIVAPDNNLWFTDPAQNSFGRIIVASGLAVTEYSVPTAGAISASSFMAHGADQRIYLTETNAGKVAQISYF